MAPATQVERADTPEFYVLEHTVILHRAPTAAIELNHAGEYRRQSVRRVRGSTRDSAGSVRPLLPRSFTSCSRTDALLRGRRPAAARSRANVSGVDCVLRKSYVCVPLRTQEHDHEALLLP